MLTVREAGCNNLQYLGYEDMEVVIFGNTYFVPVLSIQNNFSDEIPLVISTNLLTIIYDTGKGIEQYKLPFHEIF